MLHAVLIYARGLRHGVEILRFGAVHCRTRSALETLDRSLWLPIGELVGGESHAKSRTRAARDAGRDFVPHRRCASCALVGVQRRVERNTPTVARDDLDDAGHRIAPEQKVV